MRKQNKRCSVEEEKKINKAQKIADRANLIAMICCIVQELNKRC